MTDKTKAGRLADALDYGVYDAQMARKMGQAATELRRLSTVNAELLAALRALMALDVKGHALADRLQFSDAGRALLDQCRAAISRATTED
jgi:hypothetical protein